MGVAPCFETAGFVRFWAELCRFVHGGVGARKVDGRSQTKPFACKVFIVSGLDGIGCMSDRVSGDVGGGSGPGRCTPWRGVFFGARGWNIRFSRIVRRCVRWGRLRGDG